MSKETRNSALDGPAKVRLLAGWLDEKQASDIIAMDVSSVCPITEHIMVVTARGARHAQALADAMLKFAGDAGVEYLGMEGYRTADWVLMDFNDVILHIFQADVRTLYNIEGLWSEGEVMNTGLGRGDA